MKLRLLAVALVAALLTPAGSALAAKAQPPLDITKLEYAPIGHFKPGGDVPPDAGAACDEIGKPHLQGKKFNPSGKWNAFDNNVFETLCLPYRQSGDTTTDDPYGNNGSPIHGTCGGVRNMQTRPGNPAYATGECPNHQLEWIEYYEETMLEILKDFGATAHRYEFEVDAGSTPVLTNTLSGRAINPAIVVPGADHPEETVIIGAHFDQTNDGPASVWDSAEGHAEMIRVAKLMADYWRSTGTRPAATVKFIPWDGEESGTLGSRDYATNNVVPGEENRVRGYWNTDPCAGGYPSYQFGNPAYRITMGVQVASPAFIGGAVQPVGDPDLERIKRFNERAPQLIEEVLDHLDDRIESMPNQPEIFISKNEGQSDLGKAGGIQLGTTDPVLFGSDWVNFIALGIPFFNPGPSVTGPEEQDDSPTKPALPPDPFGTADGVTTFHTPNDNWLTMNRYTGGDPSGLKWSESYMKGMEFCAHMLAWGMLQHDQGGAQTTDGDVVAYAEALPNEAERGKLVTFDASGTYQYADRSARTYVPERDLQFKWEFGDGKVAYGKKVKHAYRLEKVYPSKLTVTNRATGQSDEVRIPITVVEGDGSEQDPPGQDSDPGLYPKQNEVVACQATSGFRSASVRPSGRRIRIDAQGTSGPVAAEVFSVATSGKRKRIAAFAVDNGSATYTPKRARSGFYYVRLKAKAGSRTDSRHFTLRLRGKRFRKAKPFILTPSCDVVSVYSLGTPVVSRRALGVAFATTRDTKVAVRVLRGKRTVARFTRTVQANRGQRLRIPARKLRRKGTYTVVLRAAGRTYRLYATR